MISGIILIGLGCLTQGLSAAFLVLLMAQIGIGAALVLGAQEAWLADESGSAELTKVFLRATQFGLLGTLHGNIASGLTAGIGLAVPFLVAGGVNVALGAALVFVMGEHNFQPPQHEPRLGCFVINSWHTFSEHLKAARAAMVAFPALVLS